MLHTQSYLKYLPGSSQIIVHYFNSKSFVMGSKLHGFQTCSFIQRTCVYIPTVPRQRSAERCRSVSDKLYQQETCGRMPTVLPLLKLMSSPALPPTLSMSMDLLVIGSSVSRWSFLQVHRMAKIRMQSHLDKMHFIKRLHVCRCPVLDWFVFNSIEANVKTRRQRPMVPP